MTGMIVKNRLGNLWQAPLARGFGDLFGEMLEDGLRTRPAWNAPAAIWEAEDGYHIEVDLPGMKQDAVEITFEKGELQISAERTTPDEDDRSHWHDERGYGKITRLVTLPGTVDEGAIEARLTDGVLHVVVPKVPEAQPQRIEIKGE